MACMSGGLVDTMCEMYKGQITLTPSMEGPSKTVLTYDATMVAKTASMTAQVNSFIADALVNDKLPHIQKVTASPTVADSVILQCDFHTGLGLEKTLCGTLPAEREHILFSHQMYM